MAIISKLYTIVAQRSQMMIILLDFNPMLPRFQYDRHRGLRFGATGLPSRLATRMMRPPVHRVEKSDV